MTHWDILQLAPTNDQKAIKLAYAALLKLNKPDENPEGFSALHAAYKHCVYEAKHYQLENSTLDNVSADESSSRPNSPESSLAIPEAVIAETAIAEPQSAQAPAESYIDPEKPPTEPLISNVGPLPSSVEPTLPNNNAPPLPETQYIGQEYAATNEPSEVIEETGDEVDEFAEALQPAQTYLISATDKAFATMIDDDAPAAWHFIDKCDALYDIDFKRGYNDYVFREWLNFLHEKNIPPKKRWQSLCYLDAKFKWYEHYLQFESDYGTEAITPIFETLEQYQKDEYGVQERSLQWTVDPIHSGKMEEGNYYGRLASGAFDIAAFALLFSSLPFSWDATQTLLYGTGIYCLLHAIFEASPMQGGPAKVLFGLKVTTTHGKRLNIFQSLWRQLLFSGSVIGIKLVVWINLFLGYRLLHDRLSGSTVIKR